MEGLLFSFRPPSLSRWIIIKTGFQIRKTSCQIGIVKIIIFPGSGQKKSSLGDDPFFMRQTEDR